MNIEKFYENLLDLSGLRVDSVGIGSTQITLYCSLEKEEQACPKCGTPTETLHQYKQRKVQDLRISGKEVWWVSSLNCVKS